MELYSILPICLDGECRDSITFTLTNTTTTISSSSISSRSIIIISSSSSSKSNKTQELLQTRSDPSSEFLGTIFHVLYAPYLLMYRVSDRCMRLVEYVLKNIW